VTIHTELLRIALEADEHDGPEPSVEWLVAKLAECRRRLAGAKDGRSAPGRGVADRAADLIAHDVALVRLCQRLDIDQALTDPFAPLGERDRLVAELVGQGLVDE
jgi:hypothetical protein